jgi:hypothetical protein
MANILQILFSLESFKCLILWHLNNKGLFFAFYPKYWEKVNLIFEWFMKLEPKLLSDKLRTTSSNESSRFQKLFN